MMTEAEYLEYERTHAGKYEYVKRRGGRDVGRLGRS
jgi:hypothetical protein